MRTLWDILLTIAMGVHVLGALRHLTERPRLILHLSGFALTSALAVLTAYADPTWWWWVLLAASLAPASWQLVRRIQNRAKGPAS
jgi:hypothetical protein